MSINRIFRIAVLTSAVGLLFLSVQQDGSHVGDNLRKSLKSNQYVAHEWGTFTSLQGSDGVNRPGLHHGDETLPSFVHCPLGFGYSRCLSLIEPSENSLLSATQRMETPVIYFYGNSPQLVDVTVDFPEGLISEWYPDATTFSPQPADVTQLKNGKMTWRTNITTEEVPLLEVSPTDIWQAQRQVDSNQVRVGEETDRFIFYRGIGRFSTPFATASREDGTVILTNNGLENIPAIILLDYNGEKGAFRLLDSLPAGESLELDSDDLPNAAKGRDSQHFIDAVSKALESRLTASGLFPLEAKAMVNTWKRSYFTTPGFRALYILPRQWTNALVPLQMNPVPESLERVFVGRVEIFRVAEEQALLKDIKAAIAANTDAWSFDQAKLNRFGEPKLWRLRSLADSDVERAFIDSLIEATFRP